MIATFPSFVSVMPTGVTSFKRSPGGTNLSVVDTLFVARSITDTPPDSSFEIQSSLLGSMKASGPGPDYDIVGDSPGRRVDDVDQVASFGRDVDRLAVRRHGDALRLRAGREFTRYDLVREVDLLDR